MDNKQFKELIHDSHEILSQGYGDLDIHGKVQENTLAHWNYKRNVQDPISRIVEKHLQKKPFLMLDAGCGNGQLFHLYTDLGAKAIYGVDFGRTMLGLAQERARVNSINFMPVKADLEDLRCLKNRSFDLINLYGVIEHLSNPVKVLLELERLLAAKGILVIAVPMKWSLAWLTYFFLCRSLSGYTGKESFADRLLRKKKMTLYHFYSSKEIAESISSLKSLRLLERVPVAYGGVTGCIDLPLRKLAERGKYSIIDNWGKLCMNLRLPPAGVYLVFGRN